MGSEQFLDVSLDLLTLGYCLRFQAPGRSMEPTICHGETIIAEPVQPSRVKRGDIILYRYERGVIAHRVIRSPSLHHMFHLRGDACTALDEPVEARQILGRVVSVERNGSQVRLDTTRARIAFRVRYCMNRLKNAIIGALRRLGYSRLPRASGEATPS
jgi:signal peptidase I